MGGQKGRILFPRSDMGRNEIRSQVVVSPASVMTEKLVKMAGFWIHFKDETSRILLRSLLRGVGNREQVNDFTTFLSSVTARMQLPSTSKRQPGRRFGK